MKAGRRSCAVLGAAAVSTTTGTKVGIASAGSAKRPSLAALIQFERCCGARSRRRATSAITAPGTIASATIRPFSPSLHRRRRTTLVTSARRRTTFVSSLMSTIMCTRSQETSDRALTRTHSAMWGKAPLTFWTGLLIMITPISVAAFTASRDLPMPSSRRFPPPWSIEEQEAASLGGTRTVAYQSRGNAIPADVQRGCAGQARA